jgi:hypothetical protein
VRSGTNTEQSRDEMRAELDLCKLGVGLLYSGVSLKGVQGGRVVCHWKSTTRSSLTTRRNAQRGKCIVFCRWKTASCMQPFRMTREEHPIDAREGSNELKIASMCKAKHFSYHPFFVSADDFQQTEAC